MMQDRVMQSGVAVVLGLAFALSGMGAWCADAAHGERLPVPPASDLAQARNLVRAAYEPDYAAVDQSGESAPLVAKLRAAADSAVGPLEKYAFLVEAQALATEHDDVAMALAIVDQRGEIFDIDGLAERSQALARLAGPKTVADLGIMEQAMETALKAAAVERFEIATQAATLALNVAKAVDREQKAVARRQQQRKQAPGEAVPTANGAALIKSAFELQKRISRQREMFKACEEAKAVLVNKPEDEAANAAVGTYLCFVEDDWEAGLPYLNRSRLPLVSGLARDELAIDVGDQDTKAIFDLAGKWWDAADDKRLADDEKNAIRKHAARLYGGIVTTLTNPLERRVAESRGAPQLNGDKKDSPTIVNSVGIKLKLIPAGSFMMGSEDGGADEKPVREVRITKLFYVGVTEVTNAQWKRVTGAEPPSTWKDDDKPVEQVSWLEATAFCEKLSALPEERTAGRAYRLPTEAEWEYACRAGTRTRCSFGDDSSMLPDHAWLTTNSSDQTHPVGQKKPNPWGLYDMHGNVWEWCFDNYAPFESQRLIDPVGPAGGALRVSRGNGWGCTPDRGFSSARRGWDAPTSRNPHLGFRVVMTKRNQDTVFLSDLHLTTDNKAAPIWYSEAKDFEYAKEPTGIILKKYRGLSKSVRIPVTIDGTPVTVLGNDAFNGRGDVTEVILPPSLLAIGAAAFRGCQGLESLQIPPGVREIGFNALQECHRLKRVAIPGSVAKIGAVVFNNSSDLAEIVVDPSNSVYASVDGVLYDKEIKTLISCPAGKEGDLVLPITVERILPWAFQNCKRLNRVVVPRTAKIEEHAFAGTVAEVAH